MPLTSDDTREHAESTSLLSPARRAPGRSGSVSLAPQSRVVSEWLLGSLVSGWLIVAGAFAFFEWCWFSAHSRVCPTGGVTRIAAITAGVCTCLFLFVILRLAARRRSYLLSSRYLQRSVYVRHLTSDHEAAAGSDEESGSELACDCWAFFCGPRSLAEDTEDYDQRPEYTGNFTIDELKQLARSLVEAVELGDEDGVLEILEELSTVEMTVDTLKASNLGVLVNRLRGERAGSVAQNLIEKWRHQVAEQTSPHSPSTASASSGSPTRAAESLSHLKELNKRLRAAARANDLVTVTALIDVIRAEHASHNLLIKSGLLRTLKALRESRFLLSESAEDAQA